MGGVTSNCNKNASLRQKYFEKYSEKYSTASVPGADHDRARISAANRTSSNNNKPEVRGPTGSRNRSASVGDEVTERSLRMAGYRRPLEGGRNIDTGGGGGGGGGGSGSTSSVERRVLEYGRDPAVVRQMTTAGTRTVVSGTTGTWAAARSRNSSLRSDTSRGSPNRRSDSPGSGNEGFNTGSRFSSIDSTFSRGRHHTGGGGGGGGKVVQRNSDTQLELSGGGSDVTSRNTLLSSGGGSVRIAAPPRSRTQRRSSISFLPGEATLRESALGLFPGNVRSGSGLSAAVSPMDKVNISLGNATDLVASLIGSATAGSGFNSPGGGSSGGGGSQPPPPAKQEDSFWVPSTVWRKKRALSLVPQKLSAEGDTFREGGRGVPSASNSMQEMSVECPLGSDIGPPPLVSGSGQTSSNCQQQHQLQQLQQQQLHQQQQQQQQQPGGRRRRASMQDALDFSKINASLYERPPLVSDKKFGSIQEENCGSINLSLGYETELSLLTVCVIRAQDLTSSLPGRSSVDPYCRICLLPNRKRQFHTKIQRRTTNPEFDEEFVFDVTQSELAKAALELSIFDGSEGPSGGGGAGGSTGDCLGVVNLPLDEINLTERVWMWKGISPFVNENEKDSVGELMFSMTYLSSAERLTVVVSKARNLRHQDDSKNSTVNPFVRVALLSGGKRTKKKRTSTKRNTLNPVWNEALVFCLQGKEHLGVIHLEVGVFTDNYLLGNNELIGKVVLGSENTSGDCLTHWLELVNTKNAPARWHQLQYQPEH